MQKRDIIVIGASAGGFEAIKTLVKGLSAQLEAAILIVWHMSPDVKGILPYVINKLHGIPAANAYDRELITPGRIYVAPPDRHMLIVDDYLRVTKGPKENRFRPAIDPLFRSAAYRYGNRVIGIILSGALDDGTAGLWTVKKHGGVAIVQDPANAEVASMPESAIRGVNVDYTLSVEEMPHLVSKLCSETIAFRNHYNVEKNRRTEEEIRIALQDELYTAGVQLGKLTPFTCPECHGVLSMIKEDEMIRYRCHTGHAYSAASLLQSISHNIEDSLWNAIRGIEESIALLNHLGDHFAELNQTHLAALYFKKAQETFVRSGLARKALLDEEALIVQQSTSGNGKDAE
jgi:two-component system chemotaxis response regulator CheB